jgi:hypothetical protein
VTEGTSVQKASTTVSNDNNKDEEEERGGSGLETLNMAEPPATLAFAHPNNAIFGEIVEGKMVVSEKREETSTLTGNSGSTKNDRGITELDDIAKAALSGEWSSKVFWRVKYVNDSNLEDHKWIMQSAYSRLSIDTKDKKLLYGCAMKKFIKYRIGRMRDYFVQKIRSSVNLARKAFVRCLFVVNIF